MAFNNDFNIPDDNEPRKFDIATFQGRDSSALHNVREIYDPTAIALLEFERKYYSHSRVIAIKESYTLLDQSMVGLAISLTEKVTERPALATIKSLPRHHRDNNILVHSNDPEDPYYLIIEGEGHSRITATTKRRTSVTVVGKPETVERILKYLDELLPKAHHATLRYHYMAGGGRPDSVSVIIEQPPKVKHVFYPYFEKDPVVSFKEFLDSDNQVLFLAGEPGTGKALALDTSIPTPNGWTTMGEIKVGDKVYDEQGEICNVTYVSPVWFSRPCYNVVFDNGENIIADAEHLWFTETVAARLSELRHKKRYSRTVFNQLHKRILPSVVSTDIIARTLFSKNSKRNHAIRITAPIMGQPQKFEVSPYSLGAWLGDGTTMKAEICCSNADIKIVETVTAELELPLRPYITEGKTTLFGFTDGTKHPIKPNSFVARLRAIGVLGNKHIPLQYMRSSVEQRLELLQGLMDTDGHAGKGQMEYCTTNKKLAEQVVELVSSLGMKTNLKTGIASLNGKQIGPKYRICFVGTLPCFRLNRKSNAQNYVGRIKHHYIDKCDKIESVPVRCIQVDSPSHLYLVTKSFIPTHNTTLLRAVIHEHNLRAAVVYDQALLKRDELFIEFMTEDEEDILIFEDAEALISGREEGNPLVTKFLNISDGIIKVSKKKMVFTTNSWRIQNIDPALLRPGRCFGVMTFKDLSYQEACLAAVAADKKLPADPNKRYTLATVFNPDIKEFEPPRTGF